MKKMQCTALLLLLLALCSCNSGGQGEVSATTDSASTVTVQAEKELALVSGGEAKALLIRSEDALDEVNAEFSRLYKTIGEVTGVYLEFTTDFLRGSQTRTEEEDAVPAILAGATNYTASREAMNSLNYGDAAVYVTGGQLVLAVSDQAGAAQAVDALCEYIRANGAQGELVIPADFSFTAEGSGTMAGIPVMADGIDDGRKSVGDGAYCTFLSHVTRSEYDTYLDRMQESDFSRYAVNEIGQNAFATYTDDLRIVSLVYTQTEEMLRIVVDRKVQTVLPPMEAEAYEKVCDSSLTQLGLEYNYDNVSTPYTFKKSDWQIGMCYIFRLEDGRFIIIDGGFNKDRNAKLIWDKLMELSVNPSEKKVHIAAWLLTHAHGDHYGAFSKYMETYGTRTTLDYLIYDAASDEQYAAIGESGGADAMKNAILKYVPAGHIIVARPGQKLTLANAEIEMYFTDELLEPRAAQGGNSLCIQFKIALAGQTFMFSGDSMQDATERVVALYGKELAADFVQVIHHGAPGGSVAYYQCVDPYVALWPLGEYDYYPDPQNPAKITRSTEAYNAYLYTSPKLREIILAGHTDRTLPLPYAYPTGDVVLPSRNQ